MAKITFTNKTDNQTSALAEIYKVTAANVNEIKTSVNALYDDQGGFAFYEDAATSVTPINLTQDTWTDLTKQDQELSQLTSHHISQGISGILQQTQSTFQKCLLEK